MIRPDHLIEIFKVLPTPSLVLMPNSPDFTIVEVNDTFLNLDNLKYEDLIGESFFEAFPNQPNFFLSEWSATLQQVGQDKEVKKTQVQLYFKPSKTTVPELKQVDIVNTPVLNKQNELAYILCSITTVQEVSSNKAKDLEIDKRLKCEKLFQKTSRLCGIGSWEIDLCTKQVTWCDVQKEIHEVDADYQPELVSTINFYKDNKEKAMISNLIEKALSNGNVFDVELILKTAKGNDRLVRTIGKVEMEGDKCVRLFGVTKEIAERSKHTSILPDTGNYFQSLLKQVGAVVWEANIDTYEVTFVSEHVTSILGYSPEEWKSYPSFWEDHIHKDDREQVMKFSRTETENRRNFTMDYRIIGADGHWIWVKDIVTVVTGIGNSKSLLGIMVDITTTKRLSDLEYLEKKILELNSKKGSTIKAVLCEYLNRLEKIFPKIRCAIWQVSNNRLYKWAAPSLPAAYLAVVEGMPVTKSVGCSGASAFLKHKIIVTDIKNDVRWAKTRKSILSANIRACWSYPIMNAENEVIATFGIYHPEPRAPDRKELRVIERTLAILKVILENKLNFNILQETNILMKQCQELGQFGIWSWDVVNHTAKWSDALYTIFALKNSSKASFEAYLDLLHPDDKERVSITMGGVLSTKKDVQFEERIVRPSGEVRHLKSCAKVILDDKGRTLKLIGASLDITEAKKIQEDLSINESRLRSLVETQTNYVARIDFQGRFTYCNEMYKKGFGWIYNNEDMIGQEAIKAAFPHNYERLFNLGENCISNPNSVYEAVFETPKEDGGLRVVLWHFVCLTDAKGLPAEMQAIGLDITERVLARDFAKLG